MIWTKEHLSLRPRRGGRRVLIAAAVVAALAAPAAAAVPPVKDPFPLGACARATVLDPRPLCVMVDPTD